MTTIYAFLLQTISVSFVALFLLLLKRLFEDKLSPRWQYAIWSILALRIIVPVNMQRQFFLPMPIIMETLKTTIEQSLSSVYITPYEPITMKHVFPIIVTAPNSITDWLFVFYTIGILLSTICYAISYIRLRFLLRKGTMPNQNLQQKLQTVCEQYNLKPCHAITIEGLSSAFVCGIVRPVLVIPTNKEIDEKILLHELLHVKYFDALQNVFWCVLRCLHWCNPFLYFILRRIENDMESLCDQRVLERLEGEERRAYGTILLTMANNTYARAIGTTSISNGGKNISRRITAIVRFKKYPKGMALVSICIFFILSYSTIVGTACTYDTNYFQPKSEKELFVSMAMSRINRCTTMAGALDTYAKGLLFENGIYIATASSLSKQEEIAQKIKETSDYHFDNGEHLSWWDSKREYLIYNIKEVDQNQYEVLLIIPTSYVDEESTEQKHYTMIPVLVSFEDAWVVEEIGERIASEKSPFDISYSEQFSDVPWLTKTTISGNTGTVTHAMKMRYIINNTIATNNVFFNTTTFDETIKTNATFAEARLESCTVYSCENNPQNKYPTSSLARRMTPIDSPEDIEQIAWMEQAKFSNENMVGSSTTGQSWGSHAVKDADDYRIEDIESKYRYDMSKIPLDLPWGYYLEIYWDGQLVETFTIPTPQ